MENKIRVELKIPGLNIPNNVRLINGSLTLDKMEKNGKSGEYVFDRGMSIRNLNKTLKEICGNNSYISFNLLKISDKLIKDLEESEINFINIAGASCYQSCTLQGFVHIIFPIALKNLNKERLKINKEPVKNLDELKNESLFNNTIIDILKEITYIQGCGNGGKNKDGSKSYRAEKLFKIAPPIILGGHHQQSDNIKDIDKNHHKLADESKNLNEAKIVEDMLHEWEKSPSPPPPKVTSAPPKKSGIEYKIFTGEDLIKVLEINKKTIVSEVIKFRIEGNNKYYGNMVLKFNEDNLNDPYLDIYKLINDCPQIKKNFYEKRKIVETSDILYMVVDRLDYRNTIKKQFNLYENIFLGNNGYFVPVNNENYSYTSFELKFIIFHRFKSEDSGHYTSFSKIREKWYKFDDLSSDYAKIEEPPLINNKDEDYYPVCFYYVKNNVIKNNSNLHSKNLLLFDNYNELINPYEILGITEEECKNMYQSSQHKDGDLIIAKYQKLKKKAF